MSELNLSKYGITGATEIVHNPIRGRDQKRP